MRILILAALLLPLAAESAPPKAVKHMLPANPTNPSEVLSPERLLMERMAAIAAAPYPSARGVDFTPITQEHILEVPPKKFTARRSEQECGTKKFADKLGPVRNQGGMGWCFANVAADLLSYATGKRLSENDLALQYFHFNREGRKNSEGKPVKDHASVTEFWAGHVALAAQFGARLGVCTAEEVASGDMLYSSGLARAVEEHQRPREQFVTKDLIRLIEDIATLDLAEISANAEDSCDSIEAAQRLVPKLNTWQVLSALTTANTKEEAIQWLVKQGCARKPLALPKNWKIHTYLARGDYPFGNRFFPTIDKFLQAERPVSIAFDAKRFMAEFANDANVKGSPHAAILVGKEFRDGECKYLLRNSMGTSCGIYAKPYNDPNNCQDGHIWITEKDLHETLKSMDVGA